MPTPTQLAALPLLADASVKAARSAGLPDSFADLSLAQAILESGWGERMSGTNNVFGIVADGFNGNGSTAVQTHEDGAGGMYQTVRRFQNYASLEECFCDHARIFASGPLAVKCSMWKCSAAQSAAELIASISYPSHPPNYATDLFYARSLTGILAMQPVRKALAEAKA